MQFLSTHLTEIIAAITTAITGVASYFLGSRQRKVDSVNSMRDLYNQFVEDYKDRYQELQAELDAIRKELKDTKTEIVALRKENKDLQSQLKKYMS